MWDLSLFQLHTQVDFPILFSPSWWRELTSPMAKQNHALVDAVLIQSPIMNLNYPRFGGPSIKNKPYGSRCVQLLLVIQQKISDLLPNINTWGLVRPQNPSAFPSPSPTAWHVPVPLLRPVKHAERGFKAQGTCAEPDARQP